MFYDRNNHFEDIPFLESQHYVSFSQKVDKNTAGVVSGVLPAGSIIPSNDANARAVTLNDIDIAKGSQLVGGVVEGYINAKRLPVAPTADAIKALTKITFSNVEGE